MDDNTRADRARAKGRANLVCFLLLIGLAVAGLVNGLSRPDEGAAESPAPEEGASAGVTGSGRPVENPFHHATEGDWLMLETTPVLKERKYVSSRRELRDYLVREVPAGTVLRIRGARGRWKEVDVLEDGEAVASGWVDAEKAPGTRAAADVLPD